MSTSLVETEEAAAAELQKQVADAESRKLALEAQTAGLKEHKAALEEALASLQTMLAKVRWQARGDAQPSTIVAADAGGGAGLRARAQHV